MSVAAAVVRLNALAAASDGPGSCPDKYTFRATAEQARAACGFDQAGRFRPLAWQLSAGRKWHVGLCARSQSGPGTRPLRARSLLAAGDVCARCTEVFDADEDAVPLLLPARTPLPGSSRSAFEVYRRDAVPEIRTRVNSVRVPWGLAQHMLRLADHLERSAPSWLASGNGAAEMTSQCDGAVAGVLNRARTWGPAAPRRRTSSARDALVGTSPTTGMPPAANETQMGGAGSASGGARVSPGVGDDGWMVVVRWPVAVGPEYREVGAVELYEKWEGVYGTYTHLPDRFITWSAVPAPVARLADAIVVADGRTVLRAPMAVVSQMVSRDAAATAATLAAGQLRSRERGPVLATLTALVAACAAAED